MTLISKAQIFYCLAAEIDPARYQELKKEYDEDIAKIPSLSLREINFDVYQMYSAYNKYDFFNTDQINNIIYDKILSSTVNLRNILYRLDDLSSTIDSIFNIKKFILNTYIDQFLGKIDEYEYIKLEGHNSKYVSDENFRKVQAAIIKKISNEAQSDKIDDVQNSIGAIGYLLAHSTKFSKQLLLRLAKHLGKGYYAQVMQEAHFPDDTTIKQIKNEEHTKPLTPFDIARLFYLKSRWAGKRHFFKQIIEHSDVQAKQYLRSFLYLGGKNGVFMLDDQMQPMNEDYQTLPWPSEAEPILYWNNLSSDMKERWGRIFAEFKVVPTVSFV